MKIRLAMTFGGGQNAIRGQSGQGQLSYLESHPDCGPIFTPYPLFQWYLKSKEIFIKS
jgi:hypothetical protein